MPEHQAQLVFLEVFRLPHHDSCDPELDNCPAHMLHGMSVEYMVIPRKSETDLPALSGQFISACKTTARS